MHLVKLPGVRECFTESLQAWERHSSKGNSMCKALPPELVSQNTNLVKLCPGSKPIVSPVSSLWSMLSPKSASTYPHALQFPALPFSWGLQDDRVIIELNDYVYAAGA